VIDITNDTILSLPQAGRMLPPGRGNRPVTLSCLMRWILRGARSPSGELVRLEAVRLGKRWVTSTEAMQRFVEALTPRLAGTAPTLRPPAMRLRASARAAQQLEQVGI
jgi:hypothetical protein